MRGRHTWRRIDTSTHGLGVNSRHEWASGRPSERARERADSLLECYQTICRLREHAHSNPHTHTTAHDVGQHNTNSNAHASSVCASVCVFNSLYARVRPTYSRVIYAKITLYAFVHRGPLDRLRVITLFRPIFGCVPAHCVCVQSSGGGRASDSRTF